MQQLQAEALAEVAQCVMISLKGTKKGPARLPSNMDTEIFGTMTSNTELSDRDLRDGKACLRDGEAQKLSYCFKVHAI